MPIRYWRRGFGTGCALGRLSCPSLEQRLSSVTVTVAYGSDHVADFLCEYGLGMVSTIILRGADCRDGVAGTSAVHRWPFPHGNDTPLRVVVRDGRFIYPTTYACFAPTHFLLTESWIPRLISWMLPSQRPMDGMAAGLDHPQEDEFALIGLGGPTLYYRMAFPNQPPPHMSSLNCDHMSARDIARLAKKLRWLYRAIGVRKKGRLLVKSPAHTGRMPMLAEMFPGAQFIHIVRDPKAVLPSLRHTWRILDVTQGFQTPRPELDRDALIRETFDCMYDAFDHHIERLPPGSLCELRYEDLIQDPISELERVYRKLELGDFAAVRPAIEAYLGSLAEYRTNEIRPEAIRQPSERVRWYCERYGYDVS